ncbi:glycoside hydrolase domain-containing protein [Actinomadura sp. WAC 06369]|uniref:glycoside hydrolase domain-containing protein n=1 Tax=Actinomadura sp. WAC 06369 TaxID=2203193 RepID=UPI000F76D184|nr:glycoside hydrolase domain-containing protein [Actinomadura sp. WAC 06369]RSN68384.1 hypothetical protein DMH08_11090 [Actinomadura sp. WAC 06369]
MAVFGVDYGWGRPGVAVLKSAGADFACRYVSHDRTGKNLTRAEAEALSAAGIRLVVVWETSAARALDGRDAGAADARAAAARAADCGMPGDRPIYFAVDFDASADQQPEIDAYFDGVASVLGRGRTGMYGGYGPVSRAFDAGKIAYGWQTHAWSDGRWDGRAQLRQYSSGHTLSNVSVDYNRAVADDYGQWLVGASPDAPGYVSVGAAAQPLPPAAWTTVNWNTDHADRRDRDGSSILRGPARYALTASVTVTGVSPGTLLRARAIEVREDDTAKFDAGPVHELTASRADVHVLYALPADTVAGGRRVRFQVVQHGAAEATLTGGSAKLLFWR